MRAIERVTLIAAFALLASPVTGCESSEETSTGASDIDGQSGTDGGIVTADATIVSDALLTDGETSDGSAPDGSAPDAVDPDVVDPDAGPPEPDQSISPQAKISVCKQICEGAMDDCADQVPFPDVETCREMCEADLADDPSTLSNWVCAQETCSADLCGFGDDGIETKYDPPAECIELCGHVDACGGLPQLGLPANEVGLCIGTCTGALVADTAQGTDPVVEMVVACLNGALADGCDMDAVNQCVGGEQPGEEPTASDICTYACSVIIGVPDDPKFPGCDPGSPALEEMPDFLKCMESCTMTNDPGQAMATTGCLIVSGCGVALGTVAHCFDYPVEIVPSCEVACESADAFCGGEQPPAGALCPELCSGSVLNFTEVASTEQVTECMNALDSCEDDGYKEILECHGTAWPNTPDWSDPVDICTYACAALDGDPDDPENNGCAADSPAKQEMPNFLKCMEGCTMTSDPGQAIATLGCLLISDCGKTKGTVSHCIDYPLEVLPSCGPACETVDEICPESPPGGVYCPEFCSGVMMSFDNLASTEEVAECMDEVDTCEDDGFGTMFACHIVPPDFCDDTCESLDACGMNEDGGCMDGCGIGYLGQSEDDPFPACVDDADGDCAAIGECWALLFPPDQDP